MLSLRRFCSLRRLVLRDERAMRFASLRNRSRPLCGVHSEAIFVLSGVFVMVLLADQYAGLHPGFNDFTRRRFRLHWGHLADNLPCCSFLGGTGIRIPTSVT